MRQDLPLDRLLQGNLPRGELPHSSLLPWRLGRLRASHGGRKRSAGVVSRRRVAAVAVVGWGTAHAGRHAPPMQTHLHAVCSSSMLTEHSLHRKQVYVPTVFEN